MVVAQPENLCAEIIDSLAVNTKSRVVVGRLYRHRGTVDRDEVWIAVNL